MLTCSKCREEKDESNFSIDRTTSTGRAWWCRMCVSKRDRAHYKKHKVEVKKAQKLRLTRMRDRYNMWKSQQGCCFCFETEACCLDLHHVDPKEKDINVSSLLKTRYSWERLMEEANKCVVICSNCHRKLHAGLLALS